MDVLTTAITLFLVLDPFGNIPIFLAVLARYDARRRRRIIIRELFIALAVLIVFLFFGSYILSGLAVTEAALSISGGIMLFLIAIRMIFPFIGKSGEDHVRDEDPIIVPLAVPLVAGPSALAVVTLFSTRYPGRVFDWLLALLGAWAASLIVLVAADAIRRFIGDRVIQAIERLMGMILTTLAVQMLLTGIKEFLGK